MSSFSFSFGGDDIEDIDEGPAQTPAPRNNFAAETGSLGRPSNTAFPVSGQPLLPALTHSLDSLLATLPSKIAYSTLKVRLDDGNEIGIVRRELWDVRVQLMAEAEVDGNPDADLAAGLGKDDVKTGVYEGGFKSWESSIDLVKVLAGRGTDGGALERRVLEVCILALKKKEKKRTVVFVKEIVIDSLPDGLWNCTSKFGNLAMAACRAATGIASSQLCRL
jgi:protein-histidine N-methyltransferase